MELTEDVIKRRSKQFDLGCITLLDLSNAGLRRIASLDDCVSVIKLNLANNEIADIDGLPVLSTLLSLDLSNNRLSSVDDLPRLPSLEELILTDNLIGSIDFNALAPRLPRLRKLHLERNPILGHLDTINKLRRAFPNLLSVNGEALALFEALHEQPTKPQIVSALSPAPAQPAMQKFKLAPFDAAAFANQTSARLEQMLRAAKDTLEIESSRVTKAFQLA